MSTPPSASPTLSTHPSLRTRATTSRPAGLAALTSQTQTSALISRHGSNLLQSHQDALSTQLEVFRSLLTHFAQAHMQQIREDPKFRSEFGRMCALIGVDPLLSSSRGTSIGVAKGKGGLAGMGNMWAEITGDGSGIKGAGLNDFYFSIAIRIVEICRSTRSANGGLIALSTLIETMNTERSRSGGEIVTEDDVLRAVKALDPVAPGCFAVLEVGSKKLLRSVPKELDRDQTRVLEVLEVMGGYVSEGILVDNLQWERGRAQTAIEDLVRDGRVWVDAREEEGGEAEYWSPAGIDEEPD